MDSKWQAKNKEVTSRKTSVTKRAQSSLQSPHDNSIDRLLS